MAVDRGDSVVRKSLVAGSLGLAFALIAAQIAVQAQQQKTPQELLAEQQIPDAPKPQTSLPSAGTVTPGKGAAVDAAEAPDAPGTSLPQAPAAAPSTRVPADADDQPAPLLPEAGQGVNAFTLNVGVNFVEVPFTVKDSKGRLVPGLTYHDVRIYENGLRQQMAIYTVDPFPLSVAFVIDQSMTHDQMERVNNALGSVQAAFTPYDEVAVFTYNNGPHEVTTFTGAQSARLVQALEIAKGSGRDALLAGSLDGPLANTTVINDQQFDPNTAANRGHTGMQLNPPKDVHTLNDAILAAATKLSKAATGRRRVIYVISDGKEYGSVAKPKEVVKYLQTNKIGVYGTLVGDSALWGVGFLDRIHLPLEMRDNILPMYANMTGGNFAAEFRTGEIEKSFAKIAEEVRTQYTIGYYTHEPFIDGKFRKLDVVIMNHGNNLQVLAKPGYYPQAEQSRPRARAVQ
jgi:VWFA-related protein